MAHTTAMPRLDRRTLLRGAGAMIALPFLEAMLPRSVRASTASPPKRLAFLFVPNGMYMPSWTPTAEGSDFQLTYTLEPLAPHKESLLVLTDLTQHNADGLGDGPGDHARSAGAWLTGCHPHKTAGVDIRSGISADQVAARFIGGQTRFPSLEIGIEPSGLSGECDSGYSCAYTAAISWHTESNPAAKETNPRSLFNALFGGGDDDDVSTTSSTPDDGARRRREESSILDAAMDNAKSLQRNLGRHDSEKLDEYLSSVREIERRVQFADRAGGVGTAVAPGSPTIPDRPPVDIGEHIRLMGDMMVLAFQTDQTRIATFMFANEASNRSYPEIGILEGHHEISHHGGSAEKQEKYRRINRFHVEQLAYLLQKMKDVRESDGSTLLDNTALIFGGGISDGDRHNHNDLPILVAGGGSMFKTGRRIVYADGTPMTNLFMTCFDRIGLPTEKIGSIGDSNGKLAQLF